MYKIDDIQIFITTHNRADYLKESIESILNQTAKIKEITVLDNESTDNTEEVVATFANRGVKYYKTFGFLGNFNKAREIVNKPYCMLFHDDDILLPEYLKLALNILNKHKNISLITTRYTEFWNNDRPKNFLKIKKEYYLYNKQKDFAAQMFFIENVAYATAIYRTNDFLKLDLEYDKYGKFNDWPLMVKMSGCGNSVLIKDPKIFYIRRHNGQDTWTNTNVIKIEQIINWDKLFYDTFKSSKDKELIEMYKYKSEYFLKGKYDAFIPTQEKNKFSYPKLIELAEQKGLKDICHNKAILLTSEGGQYTDFINTLKEKFLHISLLKKCFKFLYHKEKRKREKLYFICGIKVFKKRKKNDNK